MYRNRKNPYRNVIATKPFRHLPPTTNDLELLQRYAGLSAAPSGQRERGNVGGVFSWMVKQECMRDLHILDSHNRTINGVNTHLLQEPRPALCRKGTLCNTCRKQEAVVYVGVDREWGMWYTCLDCAPKAMHDMKLKVGMAD